MREQNRALVGGIIGIVITVAAFAIYYLVTLNTTFQKAVLDEVHNVDNAYLIIVRVPSSPETTEEIQTFRMDMVGFQDILNQLSILKLQKISTPIKDKSSLYIYNIYVYDKSDHREIVNFGVDNSKQISISSTKGYQRYEVTSSFDYDTFRASVDKLFTETQ
ncbi:hypothetical protein [Paenibacillus illinoisensis]|uniref:hypothetical protein n=1 Tax=Paenibacillus illinoisensis TaxID=59845 RepID=UPI00203BFD28|nr:hypothetical protein [Paenibacillus illinoisensis]MCM3207112.1 hypothetical protein [Paenibacillus illinoisensis]